MRALNEKQISSKYNNSESAGSTTSSDDNDEELLKRNEHARPQAAQIRKSRNRRYYFPQIQRSARRIKRPLLCMLLTIFCLILYVQFYTSVQTRQVALPDWSYNTSRNVADYVLPDNDTTILEPKNICRDKIVVLIIVCTSMDNFVQRQTIRETWGNTTEFNYAMFAQIHAHMQGQYLNPAKQRLKYYSSFLRLQRNQTTMPSVVPVRVAFLIGRSKYETLLGNETITRIRNESEQYGDIIQENFIDTYNNLTLKSVLALKWATKHCLRNSAYFMKCDDDTFVNIPNLLHFLMGGTVPLYNDTLDFYDVQTYQTLSNKNRLNNTRNYLVGHLFCTARPIANVSSKWYMPSYMYPNDKYPRYLSGAAYLMSMDVVPRLYAAALNTTFIYLEDIYITGMCADKVHLPRNHHPLFGYTRSKDLCSLKGTITQHDMKDDSIAEAYAFVTNTSYYCEPPGKYFKHIRLRKHTTCS